MMIPRKLINEYISALRSVTGSLHEHLTGVERIGRPGVLAGRRPDGEYVRSGSVPGLGEFAFHGMGCRIERADGALIDFDWDPEGREVFDAWRIRKFGRSTGGIDVAETALLQACRELVEQGELVEDSPGWFRLA